MTKPGDHGLVVPPAYRWAQSLQRAKAKTLHSVPGVIGSGLGFRQHKGVRTSTPTLTVFVRNKHSKPRLTSHHRKPIPRSFRRGERRLKTDVVELGKLIRQGQLGDSIGALHPRSKGTLAALAIDGITGVLCGLTAMHVTNRFEYPEPRHPPVNLTTPSAFDSSSHSLLGTLHRGTRTGVDAASIALTAAPLNELPFLGPVAGWRPTTFPADEGTGVWMFGATSGLQPGVIEYPHVDMPDDQLGEMILVRIHSDEGDSGALLVDNDRFALGLLIGMYENGLRAFSSIALVQALLGCALVTDE